MSTRMFGARITRNEDPRLLTGRAQFVDDVRAARHAACRLHAQRLCPCPDHCRRRRGGACALPGVVAVYTAADLGDYWRPWPLLVPPPPRRACVFNQRTGPLAQDKVRHVGEPIVMVVAESRYLAEDALPTSWSTTSRCRRWWTWKRALAAGAPLVHERPGLGNLAAARASRPRATTLPRAQPRPIVIRRRFCYDRGASAPMESRGVVAPGTRGRPPDRLGHDPGARSRSATAWPRMLGLPSGRCA